MNCFASVIENAIKDTLLKFGEGTIPETWLRTSLNNIDYRHLSAKQYFPQVLIQASTKYQESEGATLAVDVQLDCATYFEDDCTCAQLNQLMGNVESILDRFYFADDASEVQTYFIDIVRRDYPSFCFGGFTPNSNGFVTFSEGAQIFSYSGTIHFMLD